MATDTKALTVNGHGNAALLEKVVVGGDLKDLTPAQRLEYYGKVCESLGLNPLTKPFDYLTLNGRLTLYARKDATDQLRKIHNVSITIASRERLDDVYVVTARATIHAGTPAERSDESIGVVSIGTLKGDALANALMKAETKAKRRATLSLIGLGWLDETEVETVDDARKVAVDHETGEIAEINLPAQSASQESLQHICERCDQVITKANIGGKLYSPTAIRNWTRRELQHSLCLECVRREAPELIERLEKAQRQS